MTYKFRLKTLVIIFMNYKKDGRSLVDRIYPTKRENRVIMLDEEGVTIPFSQFCDLNLK